MITTLEKLERDTPAVVKQIHGGHRIRQTLGRLGVHPQDRLTVLRSGFLGGPVLIEIHGTEVGIGHGMAVRIEVEVTESS
ncbi:MAG: ferrous iron transport protein A [Deltaproteobacteria bacterium]|nr:ferrous iron transport protein A [Deltaproteobacteria bacterium]